MKTKTTSRTRKTKATKTPRTRYYIIEHLAGVLSSEHTDVTRFARIHQTKRTVAFIRERFPSSLYQIFPVTKKVALRLISRWKEVLPHKHLLKI